MKKRQKKDFLASSNRLVIIGVFGTEKSVGTTSVAMMLASYFSEVVCKETAYLELGDNLIYNKLLYEKTMSEENVFKEKVLKVNQFEIFTKGTGISQLHNNKYGYLIIDFGSNAMHNLTEFLRCDLKIVVSSMQIWKRKALVEFVQMSKEITGHKKWIYVVSGSIIEINKFKSKNEIMAVKMPDISNSIKLNNISMEFVEEILKMSSI